ncbi:NitT/TauT family transport system substrate-binding protein [Rhizobium sp. BK313]|uniref:ABC transporter substrate-binding protein n=1 Tax=Rhizobium sp. BK313 TaxID=2587081 RepID=UPI00105F164D|nr:ABC transporter substrate-binding protein [Rhizobium sp. BK313]MBB3457979.1 NitT/TauT family transport system substrate-binding protein [Rhizobium sp. BK313]
MKKYIAAAAALGVLILSMSQPSSAASKDVVIAEPQHGIGYLPLYVAIKKGFFEEEGINASILTVDGGGAHTNAVLAGQAFAFIGGPEHDAFAKAKGGELRAVVNIVNRGNVYLVTRKGVPAPTGDLKSYLKGKTIASGSYGGTPNSITRYILKKNGLDFKTDVTVQELSNAAILAALKTGQADIGVLTEPILTSGIKEGIWNEPFFNVPKELGPYAYSTLNVREESIKKDPELVRGFVKAVAKGLKYTHDHHEEAAEIAHSEFPTMKLEDVRATLDRAFADNIWSEDGSITRASWDTGKAVVMDAGILKTDVPYDDIIDMSFFNSIRDSL